VAASLKNRVCPAHVVVQRFQLGLERKRRRWQPMRWKISRQKNSLPIPCHVTTPLSDRKSLSP